MSSAAVESVSPLRDDSRKRRFVKLGGWAVVIVAILVVCRLLGFDIIGWLEDVWDQVTSIELKYLILGCALQTVQTTLTATSWPDRCKPCRSSNAITREIRF